jgi:hypothetical protein
MPNQQIRHDYTVFAGGKHNDYRLAFENLAYLIYGINHGNNTGS